MQAILTLSTEEYPLKLTWAPAASQRMIALQMPGNPTIQSTLMTKGLSCACYASAHIWLTTLQHVCRPPVVSVNGQNLVAFNFDYNNVLAWREEAGYSAWLQFLVLPGGPVFVGKISNSGYDGEHCYHSIFSPSCWRLPHLAWFTR